MSKVTPNPNYRFFVKPDPEANEEIARLLNAQGESAFSLETQSIEVDGNIIHCVYLVNHDMLTLLQKSPFHYKKVKAFVQEGEGKIRVYSNYLTAARRLARTKPVGHVKKQLAVLVLKKT